MFFKVSVLVVLAFVQVNVVLSQYQQREQPFGFPKQGMSTQMWDPSYWITPYYNTASNGWMDYIKKAQDVSMQLYKQWEKAGGPDMISMGMIYAQQAAKEAQKAAEEAMKQAQGRR